MQITASAPSPRSARRTFVGELDLAAEVLVRASLEDAITARPGRLEVDLSGVSFMDCSGIRVLLLARRFASQEHVRFTLVGRSRAVERMLDLTDLTPLFRVPPTVAA